MNTLPLEILMVETDEGRINQFARLLKEIKLITNLRVFQDERDALSHLSASDSLPDLILLDLLRGEPGVSVLYALRANPHLAKIPIVGVCSVDCAGNLAQQEQDPEYYPLFEPLTEMGLLHTLNSIRHFALRIIRM